MYCGKGEDDNTYGTKTEQIVMKLLKPYLMKGHHVFMDNFYNDVDLSQKLLELRTHTNGTVHKNRKTNPKGLTQIKLKRVIFVVWSLSDSLHHSVSTPESPQTLSSDYSSSMRKRLAPKTLWTKKRDEFLEAGIRALREDSGQNADCQVKKLHLEVMLQQLLQLEKR